jgi:hypothetical protein
MLIYKLIVTELSRRFLWPAGAKVSFLLLAIALIFPGVSAFGQFINVNDVYGVNQLTTGPSGFGHAMSLQDFNNDGLDDISFGTTNQDPQFYLNTGTGFELVGLGVVSSPNSVKSILWVDIDNDGDKDLFLSYENSPVRLYENLGNLQLEDITFSSGLPIELGIRNYGAGFGDYNNDGYLDLYICKYYNNMIVSGEEFENKLYRNNGNKTFTDITNEANANVGINASFMATWFDYDEDGWQDIFVVNDRIFNRNQMLRNNGDGTFTEVALETGLEAYIDAMGCSLGDFNNDMLLDFFVANSQWMGNYLYKHLPGHTFSNIAPVAGVEAYNLCWSGLWLDYDNNGWLDLHVGTEFHDVTVEPRNYFFVNNQDETFSEMGVELGLATDNYSTFSTAQGDWNMDGYQDFVSHGMEGSPSQLWQNVGGQNNYLAVTLQGVISNRDGVGSVIRCYAGGAAQMRYVACGENYLAQNSHRKVFGLGDVSLVDSLVVTWLSGQVDRYFNVSVNQTVHVIEGSGYSNSIVVLGEDSLCPGEAVSLYAGSWDGYLWSTGDTVSQITVSEPGNYYVTVFENGFSVPSDTIELFQFPQPVLMHEVSEVSCNGGADGAIALANTSGSGIASVLWQPEGEGDYIEGLTAGDYSYVATDLNGCLASGSISMDGPPPLLWEVLTSSNQDSCSGGWSAEVLITGGTPPYAVQWSVTDSASGELLLSLSESYSWCYEGNESLGVVLNITDFNGCAGADSFWLSGLVSVGTDSYNHGVSLFPNPVQSGGVLSIFSVDPVEELVLFSVSGSEIMRLHISQGHEVRFGVSVLPAGVYLLKTRTRSGRHQTTQLLVTQ